MNKIKKSDYFVHYSNQENIKYFDAIKKNNYEILKILKDDKRSYVALIEICKEKLVYKIPKEKNNRKWQRFLSIFRGSKSKREFIEIEKINKLGFKTGIPILAVDKKVFFQVVDSYFLYTYVDGRQSKSEDVCRVAELLKEIHKLGYLHGDSQLENFIVSATITATTAASNTTGSTVSEVTTNITDEIYLIDVKFTRNIYKKFGEAYEFIYLEESCHRDNIVLYDRKSIYYKVAMLLKRFLEFKRKLRKKD